MGFLGSLFGWDQSMGAVNAVLANHLLEMSEPKDRKRIASQVVDIVSSVQRRKAAQTILGELSERPRTVQMNFVALACDNLGIAPPIPKNVWTRVKNPYWVGGMIDAAHIKGALYLIEKQDRVRAQWPGNNPGVDFRKLYEDGALLTAAPQDAREKTNCGDETLIKSAGIDHRQLAKAQDPRLRENAAGDPHCPTFVLSELAHDNDLGVLKAVILNPAVTSDMLETISQGGVGEEIEVAQLIANHPKCPAYFFDVWASFNNKIDLLMARNRSCPPRVLAELKFDHEQGTDVHDAATQNPSFSEIVYLALVKERESETKDLDRVCLAENSPNREILAALSKTVVQEKPVNSTSPVPLVEPMTDDDAQVFGDDLLIACRCVCQESQSIANAFLLRAAPSRFVTEEIIETFGDGLIHFVRRKVESIRRKLGVPSQNSEMCQDVSEEDLETFGQQLVDFVERIALDEFAQPNFGGDDGKELFNRNSAATTAGIGKRERTSKDKQTRKGGSSKSHWLECARCKTGFRVTMAPHETLATCPSCRFANQVKR